MKSKGIILADVDGVLNRLSSTATHPDSFVFEPECRSDEASGRFCLNLSREMGQAIVDLDCTIMWLTTWVMGRDQATSNIGNAIGWSDVKLPTVLPRFSEASFSWKPKVARDILSQPGGPVVWIDDDLDSMLSDEEKLEIDPHGRLLCICPDSAIGLTKQHLRVIRSFLDDYTESPDQL